MEFIFNPFDLSKRMNWNLWVPSQTNLSHLNMEEAMCLMLDRKTGKVYVKEANKVTLMEWNQFAGHEAVVAVATKSECF